jgi:hypothetical protein
VLCFSAPAWTTSFFLAPSTHSPAGSDANNGTSAATPWLSPNHAVNCATDDITALTDTGYATSQFTFGSWGTVTCSGGAGAVMVHCQTFAGCTLTDSSASTNAAIVINAPYWGISGFVVTRTGATQDGSCIWITGGSTITHHVVIANNVVKNCIGGGIYGITTSNLGTDYIAIVGNAVYASAGGTTHCNSGISTIGMQNFDTLPGTHQYIAGNFAWGNVQGTNCNGSANSDGEGIQIDQSDGSYFASPNPYTGQTVMENNMMLGNGNAGVVYTRHKEGTQVLVNNTSFGNFTDSTISEGGGVVGEFRSLYTSNVQVYNNITQATRTSQGSPSSTVYGFTITTGDASSVVDNNWFVNTNVSGQNAIVAQSASTVALGGRNILGLDPKFACGSQSACTTAIPGSPSCSGKANVVDCMATTIANFTPTAPGAIGMGYQQPRSTAPSIGAMQDALFPAWLCNVTLPGGILSKHC